MLCLMCGIYLSFLDVQVGDIIRNLNEQNNQSWVWGYVTEKDENNRTIKVQTGKQCVQKFGADEITFQIR